MFPVFTGELEVRQGGGGAITLAGRFQYGSTATLSDRGRVRKERFEPHAFAFAVDLPDRQIHLLSGHSFDRPLAAKLAARGAAGTLALRDTAEALEFEAELPPEAEQPTYMRDVLAQHRAGLIGGISPGFTVPPASTVPDAEVLEPEPGNRNVMIRSIRQAVLYELSLVTRPAYPETEVDMRGFDGEARPSGRVPLWL